MAMDLDIRTRGRPGAVIEVETVAEIAVADLPLLSLPRASATPSPIRRLRDRHHRLAQHLASGINERDAAIICGYDVSRVSILKADPAFKELLEFYRERQAEKFDGIGDKLATITNEALDTLIDRLEDDDQRDAMPLKTLMELATLGTDRIGYGPQSKSESLNVNVGLADTLSEARKRVAERRMRVIGGSDAGETS